MTFSSGGRAGNEISKAIQTADRNLQSTQTFGLRNRILCILRTELQWKYGIDGWNGYGAKAVETKSIECAEAFVKLRRDNTFAVVTRNVEDCRLASRRRKRRATASLNSWQNCQRKEVP